MDKVRLMAELSNEKCTLNHGPGTQDSKVAAADYIVMSFWYAQDDVQEIAVRELGMDGFKKRLSHIKSLADCWTEKKLTKAIFWCIIDVMYGGS